MWEGSAEVKEQRPGDMYLVLLCVESVCRCVLCKSAQLSAPLFPVAALLLLYDITSKSSFDNIRVRLSPVTPLNLSLDVCHTSPLALAVSL